MAFLLETDSCSLQKEPMLVSMASRGQLPASSHTATLGRRWAVAHHCSPCCCSFPILEPSLSSASETPAPQGQHFCSLGKPSWALKSFVLPPPWNSFCFSMHSLSLHRFPCRPKTRGSLSQISIKYLLCAQHYSQHWGPCMDTTMSLSSWTSHCSQGRYTK